MFLRPKIELHSRHFIDYGIGQAVAGEVDGFEILFAGVTTFNPHVFKFCRRKDRQLGMVLFAAGRAQDTPELPLGEAEGTNQ